MSFNIVVLAKQVPDTRNVGKDAMTPQGTVNRAALPAIFNPEDLNALEARDVDAFVGVVATHPTTVFEEDEVFLRQPVQAERRAHTVGHVREGGGQFLQGFVEG